MVTRVIALEVEKEEKDINYYVVVLVLFLSSFIGLEELFGVGDVCFWFPGAFCFRVSFPVN